MKKQKKLDQLAAELGNAVYHQNERYICFNAGQPSEPYTAIVDEDHFKGQTLIVSGSTPGCKIYRSGHVAEAFLHIRKIGL